MAKHVSFVDDNKSYETWLGTHCDVVKKDLRRKHEAMAADAFTFLRATYFRWASTIEQICPDAKDAPITLCVGDIHLENFGTWRDEEGRLVWGVNDFDEAYDMPYVFDLVRLATSARMAPKIDLSGREIARAILTGYAKGLKLPRPTLVNEEATWMLPYLASSQESSAKFWKKVTGPRKNPKPAARNGLARSLPRGAAHIRYSTRVAGAGSLGRSRYVAVAEFQGGRVVREAKALVPSAWTWAHDLKSVNSKFLLLANGPHRSPDPFMSVGDGFVFRRLAPDSEKVELGKKGAEEIGIPVLTAMGFDLAAIHAARRGVMSALKADLRKRNVGWLREASKKAAAAVTEDWNSWRKSQR